MSEPRARITQNRGQPHFDKDLKLLMYAYGDDPQPLEETIKVMDEIVTDFIIEISHEAAHHAKYAGRQKIKVDDFRFALRRDPLKLGRVQDLLTMDKSLKEAKKAFNENDDSVVQAAEARALARENDSLIYGSSTKDGNVRGGRRGGSTAGSGGGNGSERVKEEGRGGGQQQNDGYQNGGGGGGDPNDLLLDYFGDGDDLDLDLDVDLELRMGMDADRGGGSHLLGNSFGGRNGDVRR
ncbi:MAG: hypothetical protein M1823_001422 [Watsoniomyces obsoletus]|nr:MAG: hypothetical protein M1823_001422 [Watsoniomyces obsoletus]